MDHRLMNEKILIMTNIAERKELYEFVLKSKGYVTKVLEDKSHIRKHLEWKYTEEMVKDVLKFYPRLIICDLGAYMAVSTEVLEFLLKIRDACDQDPYPLNLVILPRDYFPDKFEFLIDEFLPSPIDVKLFLDTVGKLLT